MRVAVSVHTGRKCIAQHDFTVCVHHLFYNLPDAALHQSQYALSLLLLALQLPPMLLSSVWMCVQSLAVFCFACCKSEEACALEQCLP